MTTSSTTTLSHLEANVPRTARGLDEYAWQFGPAIHAPGGGDLVLDLGAGDAPYGAARNANGFRVLRCDPSYAGTAPDDRAGAVAGLAQTLPLPDDRFSRVLASWVTPHIEVDDLGAVLYEMIRVTRPGGSVMIYPLFHIAAHLVSEHEFVYEKRFRKGTVGTTLVIVKDAEVPASAWPGIADDLARTSKLRLSAPLMRWRERRQRRLIKARGTNRVKPTFVANRHDTG